ATRGRADVGTALSSPSRYARGGGLPTRGPVLLDAVGQRTFRCQRFSNTAVTGGRAHPAGTWNPSSGCAAVLIASLSIPLLWPVDVGSVVDIQNGGRSGMVVDAVNAAVGAAPRPLAAVQRSAVRFAPS